MFSFIAYLEEFIYPQYCHKCDRYLINSKHICCTDCVERNIELTRLGNLYHRIEFHTDLDYELSFYWFGWLIQNYIHHLKNSGWEKFLTKLIETALKIEDMTDIPPQSVIVPVPLHRVKQRSRGFNQSRLIGNILSQKLKYKMNNKILRRIKYTRSQTALTIEQRQHNMENAFMIKKETPKNVLLIDDVLTTGSSADACAKTLKSQGAIWLGIVSLVAPRLNIS